MDFPSDEAEGQYIRTRGCGRCKDEAQYMAFETSYKPLTEKQRQQALAPQPRVSLGTGSGAVRIPVTVK